MGATVRQFKDGIKHDMLFLDTSFLVDSICPRKGTPRSRISECGKFWKKLGNRIAAKKLLCYVSDLVLDEFYFYVVLSHYERELPKYPLLSDWHELYRDHPELLPNSLPQLDQFYSTVILLGILLTQPCDMPRYVIPPLVISAKQIMVDFYMLPTDAFHIATAKALGIEAIVALDEHFHEVDGIVIYTCLPP